MMPVTRTPRATPGEVAENLRKSPKALAEWPSRGMGPRYCRLGADVRYDYLDVDAWLDAPTGGPGVQGAA